MVSPRGAPAPKNFKGVSGVFLRMFEASSKGAFSSEFLEGFKVIHDSFKSMSKKLLKCMRILKVFQRIFVVF